MSENIMKWIPISDRLPERGKDHEVLVTVRHKNPEFKGHVVVVAEYDTRDYDADYWHFRHGFDAYDDLYVSAWMPMPEPYRGESE